MKKLILITILLVCCAAWLRSDTLSTLLSVDLRHDLKKVTGSATTTDKGNWRISQGFINGTATDSLEANAVLTYSADITSASAVIIDLNAATDPFGGSVALDTVKAMALRNLDTSNSITLGDGTSSSFSAGMAAGTIVTIPPTGAYIVTAPHAGWSVATPAYIIINTDSTAEYDLRIIGTQ
jgi:hypothetical protein